MSLAHAVPAMAQTLVEFLLAAAVALSLLLTIQSVYTLYIMLYTWDRPDAYRRARAPARFRQPDRRLCRDRTAPRPP